MSNWSHAVNGWVAKTGVEKEPAPNLVSVSGEGGFKLVGHANASACVGAACALAFGQPGLDSPFGDDMDANFQVPGAVKVVVNCGPGEDFTIADQVQDCPDGLDIHYACATTSNLSDLNGLGPMMRGIGVAQRPMHGTVHKSPSRRV